MSSEALRSMAAPDFFFFFGEGGLRGQKFKYLLKMADFLTSFSSDGGGASGGRASNGGKMPPPPCHPRCHHYLGFLSKFYLIS